MGYLILTVLVVVVQNSMNKIKLILEDKMEDVLLFQSGFNGDGIRTSPGKGISCADACYVYRIDYILSLYGVSGDRVIYSKGDGFSFSELNEH